MPVNTEQWGAEIGSFNGCSLHLNVKLHLHLLNLLFSVPGEFLHHCNNCLLYH